VDRIRRDDVERLLRRRQEVPRIVEDQLYARIVEHVMVLVAEERARAAWHRRLDLADHDPLNLGMDRERACGHAGADADDQD
jgi:hypothetical protein